MPELWEVTGAAKIRLFGPKDALDRVTTPDGVEVGRVAPDELLWLADPGRAEELEAEGKRQLAGAGQRALVVDNSDGWTMFSIVGDGRAAALARLSSLRLPDRGFRQGKVAEVPGKVFARPGGSTCSARRMSAGSSTGVCYMPAPTSSLAEGTPPATAPVSRRGEMTR